MFSICRESRSLPAEGADFLVETATGEASVKELEGIVVAMRPARIFFAKPYGSRGGKRPPSCTSINGMEGIGDPDVKCRDCPYSKFGSAQNPDGSQKTAQACKELRQVLLLLPGEILPHLLNIPPTSIKPFS